MSMSKIILLVTSMALSLVLNAQEPVKPVSPPTPPAPEKPVSPPTPPEPPSMEEIQQKLKEAQKRMEEAVRDVTRYSTQVYTHNGPDIRHFFISAAGDRRGAMLGVHIEEIVTTDKDKIDGVIVVGVTPNGPAEESGLKGGDKIVAIDGTKLVWNGEVSPVQQLLNVMAEVNPEQAVSVEFERDGKAQSVMVDTEELGIHNIFASEDYDFDFDFDFDVDVDNAELFTAEQERMLAEREKRAHDKVRSLNNRFYELRRFGHQPWHDIELMSLTKKLGRYFDTDKGLLVVSINDNEELELEEGDVILEIDGREPKDPAHAMRILNSYQAGETAKLRIMRDKRKRNIEIKVEEQLKDVHYEFPIEEEVEFILPEGSDQQVKIKRLNIERHDSI